MGFLKFLKRDKSKEPELGLDNADDLDMPPPPPDLPGFPEFGGKDFAGKKFEDLPELPELPESDEPFSEEEPLPELKLPESLRPELKFPSLTPQGGIEPAPTKPLPNVPEFPKLEEIRGPKFPQPRRPLFGVQRPEPSFGPWPSVGIKKPQVDFPKARVAEIPKSRPEIRPYERLERAAVREERGLLRHNKEAKGPIFIRVERFRDILTGTKTIKNNLKIAEQTIIKLNEIDEDRDKVFDKWHNAMADLQKKLIFMDKTLFKR